MPLAFDPLYLLLMLPGMAVAGWAQTRIASAYREGSRYRVSSGVTGPRRPLSSCIRAVLTTSRSSQSPAS